MNDMIETIKQAAEFAASLPPRRTLHCHPSVPAALIAAAPPPAAPSWTDLGRIGSLTGIDVYEDDEMMTGAWEIREGAAVGESGKMEGGNVVSSGVQGSAT